MAKVQEQLQKEVKMKYGMDSLLRLYLNKDPAAYQEVQTQLDLVNAKIRQLTTQLDSYKSGAVEPRTTCRLP